mmetsp:Transcript_45478/g.97446  ORF Transcript_45478/g.97446 Transcript_45478/m.97446 type:complete len:232 (-) Transcript_45478:459-1154(-)
MDQWVHRSCILRAICCQVLGLQGLLLTSLKSNAPSIPCLVPADDHATAIVELRRIHQAIELHTAPGSWLQRQILHFDELFLAGRRSSQQNRPSLPLRIPRQACCILSIQSSRTLEPFNLNVGSRTQGEAIFHTPRLFPEVLWSKKLFFAFNAHEPAAALSIPSDADAVLAIEVRRFLEVDEHDNGAGNERVRSCARRCCTSTGRLGLSAVVVRRDSSANINRSLPQCLLSL